MTESGTIHGTSFRPPTAGLAGVKLHFVDTVTEAGNLMTWLGNRREVLAVDTETEGLEWWHDKVRLIQLGDEMDGWAIPWEHWGGVALEAMKKYTDQMVMHNAKFDTHMIERWTGLEMPHFRIDDTRIMAHVMDPTRSTALKNLTRQLIDAKSATASRVLDEAMASNGWTWATVPIHFQSYWAYGALDTVLTARLWHLLRPQVLARCPKAYDLELGVTWPIMKMERRGFRVDADYTRTAITAFEMQIGDLETWCREHYNIKPQTDAEVIRVLTEGGVDLIEKYTATGRRSLDKDVLIDAAVRGRHPLAQVVLDRRRLQKILSTYLQNFLKYMDGNNILHPMVNTLGARTSRQSMQNPNLHNLSRRSNDNPAANTVRNCLIAREGHELILCDFDQIEMRIIAHLAQDDGLRQAFQHGDFFTNVARELYADPQLAKKDPRRQLTKNGMYALGYGAGPAKIALTTGRSLEEVQAFLDGLNARFPGIKMLQRTVSQRAEERQQLDGVPYVMSPLTGRWHVADDDKAYTLVNYLVQGTAAEVLKLKILELAAAGFEEHMILTVHDEVILDVHKDDAAEAARMVEQVMTDHTLFSVPLTAGVDRTERWGMKGT